VYQHIFHEPEKSVHISKLVNILQRFVDQRGVRRCDSQRIGQNRVGHIS